MRKSRRSLALLGILATASLVSPLPARSQDVVLAGSGSGSPGTTVHVAIGIQDVAGTDLGVDRLPGNRIQALAVRVTASPASAVVSLALVRAGLLATLTPLYETTTASTGAVVWVGSFSELTDPIPFTQPPGPAGDQVLDLAVSLSSDAMPGSVVTLELDAAETLLSNQGGTVGESVGNGRLQLGPGSVTVSGYRLHLLDPCRVIDTRQPDGPLAGPILPAGVSNRTFVVTGVCGIPGTAKAISVNQTVTQPAAAGHLRVYPGNLTETEIPDTTSVSFGAGRTRANSGVVLLATTGDGSIGVQNDAPGALHFILDVTGYFE